MDHKNSKKSESDSLAPAYKHKKRNKKLLSQLQDQIEFYFSDPNLTKDKFLKQQIAKNADGYVGIKVIAGFRKMKQMTEDLKLVVKAMKNSSVVEVSEDEKYVRRVAPLPEERNVDKQTIYVEKLPPYADHDWLKSVFDVYGKVVFVSIPKFKTGEVKGFAFVEFETKEDASNALQAFTKRTSEEAVLKGHKDEEHSEDIEVPKEKKKRKRTVSEVEETTALEMSSRLRKRKRCVSESEVENTQKLQDMRMGRSKRVRTTSESSADSDSAAVTLKRGKPLLVPVVEDNVSEGANTAELDNAVHWKSTSESAEYKQHRDSDGVKLAVKRSQSDIKDTAEEESCRKPKKAKKRKKKEKKEKKETRKPPLTVMSKTQWLELKQQYKALQKESIRKVKEALRTNPSQSETLPADTKNDPPTSTASKLKELPFIPGVVLRLQCPPFEMSKDDVKKKLTQIAPVAYLDYKDGAREGYARFHTVENCNNVLNKWLDSDQEAGLCVHRLSDLEEKEYWEKVNLNRQERFNAKRPKKRGSEKIAKKAEAVSSHIIFD